MVALASTAARALELKFSAGPQAIPIPHFALPPKVKRAGRPGSRARLIADRSSSVRKLQRWLNNGDMIEMIPRRGSRG